MLESYRVRLHIDYVPESLGYTGPRMFELSPTQQSQVVLPVAAVSNPLDGVRLSLSVTVPEPAGLSALALGLVPLAAAAVNRRRTKR